MASWGKREGYSQVVGIIAADPERLNLQENMKSTSWCESIPLAPEDAKPDHKGIHHTSTCDPLQSGRVERRRGKKWRTRKVKNQSRKAASPSSFLPWRRPSLREKIVQTLNEGILFNIAGTCYLNWYNDTVLVPKSDQKSNETHLKFHPLPGKEPSTERFKNERKNKASFQGIPPKWAQSNGFLILKD